MTTGYKDYGWRSAAAPRMHARFMPHILDLAGELPTGVRVPDVGCRKCGFTPGDLFGKGIERPNSVRL